MANKSADLREMLQRSLPLSLSLPLVERRGACDLYPVQTK